MTREERENAIRCLKMWIEKEPYLQTYKTCLEALEQEPCDNVVSRAELLKAIDTWDKFGCNADTKLVPYQDHYIPYIHYDDVVKCIKGMPSVRPQEQTGHWILKRTFPTKLYDEYLNEYKCSECYREIRCTESQLVNYPYCHCGARMESEDKE